MVEEHQTTMTPHRRKELIRILKSWYPLEALAELTDRELHVQWLADCEYVPKGRATL